MRSTKIDGSTLSRECIFESSLGEVNLFCPKSPGSKERPRKSEEWPTVWTACIFRLLSWPGLGWVHCLLFTFWNRNCPDGIRSQSCGRSALTQQPAMLQGFLPGAVQDREHKEELEYSISWAKWRPETHTVTHRGSGLVLWQRLTLMGSPRYRMWPTIL